MFDISYYRSLTRSLIISVVLVSFAPLILLSVIVSYNFKTAYHQKVMDHLEVVVEKHKQNIDGFLNERFAEIQILTQSVPFERFTSSGDLHLLLEDLQKFHSGVFVDLGLINQNGIQVTYAGPFDLESADYSNAEWFKEVMEKESTVSDVFTGLRGIPHFIVAVLLEDAGEQWVFRATIDFDAFNYLVENIKIGRTGLSFIINRQGKFQTKPRVDVASEIPAILSFIESRKGLDQVSISDRSPPGMKKDVILVTSPMKNNQWTLIFMQDEKDAFASLYQTIKLAFGVFLLGGVSIVLVATWRSRRIVTEIRQTDHEKDILNKQVIKAGKLATVGELAAGIAHEINNPVAIIVEESGWINDILADVRDGALSEDDRKEIDDALEQIRTQGARCKEITHKLLSFARKTDSTVKAVQLNDLINEMADFSEQRARIANVEIRRELSPTLPGITASPSELQQVFLNLINNAVDALKPKGGTLTMRSFFQKDHLYIEIEDTGEGISLENLSRIFDPFFTTKPVGKGTGLGLSICYGIIKKMHGDITVTSELNKGTKFTVILPLDDVRERKEEDKNDSGLNTDLDINPQDREVNHDTTAPDRR